MPWVSVSGKNYCLIDPMLLIALVQKAAWGLRGEMHLDDCVPLRPEGSHWLLGLLDTSQVSKGCHKERAENQNNTD